MTDIIGRLTHLLDPPEPSYKNVIPNGPGWYQYRWWQWRLTGQGKGARYITEDQLWLFALEAARALRGP